MAMLVNPRRWSTLLARARREGRPIDGCVDVATSEVVAGWALGARVQVRVGDLIAEYVDCNLPRPDLLDAGFPHGAGFHLQLPSGLLDEADDATTQVSVIDAENGRPLLGAPATIVHLRPRPERALHVFSVLFFDAQGREFLHGGAERYIIDLAELAASAGLTTVVYQASSRGPWTQVYRGIAVRGVPWDFQDIKVLSSNLFRAAPPAALNVYSPFVLAVTAKHSPAIGISHGVFWDAPGNQFQQGSNEELILSGIKHCDQVVSVDTNTINFVRAVRSDLANHLSYLPNYVSDEFFSVPDSEPTERDVVVIGFPRRLYDPRGLGLLEAVIPEVVRNHSAVRFDLVGGISEEDRPRLDHLLERFPGQVTWRQVQPDEMSDVYPTFDIALIPTVHSEGTSLSALEAMAAGNCVIATNVGGLTDIVVNEFNGLLIEPTAEALATAIERALLNADLRGRLGVNARSMARQFGHSIWVSRWRGVFDEHLDRGAETIARAVGDAFVHVRTPGITWGQMAQRPHHIARALASQGVRVYFCSDDIESEETLLDAARVGVAIIQPDSELHLDAATLYSYYAHGYSALEDHLIRVSKGDLSESRPHPDLRIGRWTMWFDVLDHPGIHVGDDRYEAVFRHAVTEADIVTCSSEPLRQLLLSSRSDVALIPNGVFPEDFALARRRQENLSMEEFRHLTSLLGMPVQRLRAGSVALFYGALAEWVDFDLLDRVADGSSTTLVVAGPVTPDVRLRAERLFARSNVRYVGVLPYRDLEMLAREATFGVVPFSLEERHMVDAVLPLKLLEFLAAGLPVVSTRLAAIEQFVEHLPEVAQSRIVWADDFGTQRAWSRLTNADLTSIGAMDAGLDRVSWRRSLFSAPIGLARRGWVTGGIPQSAGVTVLSEPDGRGISMEVPLSSHREIGATFTIGLEHGRAVEVYAWGHGTMLGGDRLVQLHLGPKTHAFALCDVLAGPQRVALDSPGDVPGKLLVTGSTLPGEGMVIVGVRPFGADNTIADDLPSARRPIAATHE